MKILSSVLLAMALFASVANGAAVTTNRPLTGVDVVLAPTASDYFILHSPGVSGGLGRLGWLALSNSMWIISTNAVGSGTGSGDVTTAQLNAALLTNNTSAPLGGTLTIAGTAKATNVWDKSNVKWWGAVGDGNVYDDAAVSACISNAVADVALNGVVYFPPGRYALSNSIVVTTNSWESGTGYALKVIGDNAAILWFGNGYVFHGIHLDSPTISGVRIDYISNTNVVCGAVLWENVIHGTIRDVRIKPNVISTAPAIVVQSMDTNGTTGSYWNNIEDVVFKPNAPGVYTGIKLAGHANATRIVGCSFSHFNIGILCAPLPGEILLVNSVAVDDCRFEIGQRSVVIDGEGGSTAGGGVRVINSRFELVQSVLNVTNRTTAQIETQPFLAGNDLGYGTASYVTGSSSYTGLDVGDATGANPAIIGKVSLNGLVVNGGDLIGFNAPLTTVATNAIRAAAPGSAENPAPATLLFEDYVGTNFPLGLMSVGSEKADNYDVSMVLASRTHPSGGLTTNIVIT